MIRSYIITCFVVLAGVFYPLEAATTANATITYTIGSIDSLAISGNPGTLTINSATAGSSPTAASDTTTTYAVTTNNSGRTITGQLSSALPTGVSLSVTLAAPTGATSAGSVTLTTSPQSLVTGISTIAEGSLLVTYYLTATTGSPQAAGSSTTVTYTLGP